MPAAAIKQTAIGGQQAGQQRAQNTTYSVDRRSADRVVDMKPAVDEFNREDQYGAADQADEDRSERRDQVAAGRDTDETGQNAVQRQ